MFCQKVFKNAISETETLNELRVQATTSYEVRERPTPTTSNILFRFDN